jgi:hypothetical protein
MINLSPEVRILAGFVYVLAFGWFYFRRTRGAGKVLFILLLAATAILFWFSALGMLLAFLGLGAWVVWELSKGRKSRPEYRPAVAIAEGGGVKRGLTAPEAAVLLEMPLNTVLAAVLVGLLKKGAIRPTDGSPSILEVTPDFLARESSPGAMGRAAHRRAVAQRYNAVLHPYEEPFLELFEENGGRDVGNLNFTVPLRALLRETARRVGGHDLDATREYYRKHMGRARHDVARADGSPEGNRLLAHHLEWLVLDEEFAKLYREYRPGWLAGVDTDSEYHPELADWIAGLQRELAGSIPDGGLQGSSSGGERIALGGDDPVNSEFFRQVYDQVWKS